MTFSLQELKRVAAGRTSGKWDAKTSFEDDGSYEYATGPWHNRQFEYNKQANKDAEFIAYCANNIDAIIARLEKLEAVAEAAKNLTKEGSGCAELDYWDGRVFNLLALEDALKALGEEP